MALLQPQAGPLPVARPSVLSAPFWEGTARGELRFPRCRSCGAPDFPAAPHCRFCLEDALEWQVSAGRGIVYSYTVVWRPVTPAFGTPYAPAIVTLDEGYSMMTNLVGLDSEEAVVDMAVQVHFVPVTAESGAELTLPCFRPA